MDVKNIKHSKVKNTGLLFELLVRQTTADVLAKKEDDVAIKLIGKYFGNGKPLNKELKLYKALIEARYSSESKAKDLITEIFNTRKKISNAKLKNEKYNLVKEIKEHYSLDEFFSNKLTNYKELASIYLLFESATDETGELSPVKKVQCKHTIIENITGTPVAKPEEVKNETLDEFRKQNDDLRKLTYKIMLDKFNEKYQGLDARQKELLREYIYNVSNTNQFRDYVDTQIDVVKDELTKISPKIEDKSTRIKVEGVAEQIEKLKKGKVVKEEQLVQLMKYYELAKEVKKVAKCPKGEKVNG